MYHEQSFSNCRNDNHKCCTARLFNVTTSGERRRLNLLWTADLFLIISLLFIARSDALRSNRAHCSCVVKYDKIRGHPAARYNLSDFYRENNITEYIYVYVYMTFSTAKWHVRFTLARFVSTESERLLRSNVDLTRDRRMDRRILARQVRARFLHRNVTYQHRCQLFRGYLLLKLAARGVVY